MANRGNREHIPTVLGISDQQVRNAQLQCAIRAQGADDLALLLDMIGISGGWQESWVGPILDLEKVL